jgi:hypothetical protein
MVSCPKFFVELALKIFGIDFPSDGEGQHRIDRPTRNKQAMPLPNV